MRQGQQHRRGRGRNNNNNNRRGQNPLARSFESNGPDVKVRGTPADIAAKYLSLARDAQSAGDPVLAENYFQHAEHYNRIIMAYREQQQMQQPEGMNGSHQPRLRHDPSAAVEGDDIADDDGQDDLGLGEQPSVLRGAGEQPRLPDAGMRPDDGRPMRQDHQPRDQHGRDKEHQPRDHQPRFRDRHEQRFHRHERGERQERNERQERFAERGRGFDRPQPEVGAIAERAPLEPQSSEPQAPERAPEVQDLRAPRPRSEESPAADSGAPARAEGGGRRRERFGIGNDQPEFLRRPVRRPRREGDSPAAPGEAPAGDDSPQRD
jgi:hypothetical protein